MLRRVSAMGGSVWSARASVVRVGVVGGSIRRFGLMESMMKRWTPDLQAKMVEAMTKDPALMEKIKNLQKLLETKGLSMGHMMKADENDPLLKKVGNDVEVARLVQEIRDGLKKGGVDYSNFLPKDPSP